VALFTRDTDSKVKALQRASLFEGLSKEELEELAKRTDDVDFSAGKVLCREGESGGEFYVITEGEADVTRDGESIATLGEGDFFGEVSLVQDSPRNATVTATTPLRAFVLTRGRFLHLMDDSPGVDRKVMHALAKRLASVSDDPTL
jgi:CRP-like cAMP-binding protein